MKNDLIDRYIYAATKRMKPKLREDVRKELYGLVDDMLAERCGGMTPTEKDIRVVLTELGTPQELYAKYDEDSDKCLIEQPYYSTYKLVMKVVLAAVAIGMTVSAVMTHFAEAQLWYESVLTWLSMMWSGCLQAFAVVTLLFAIFSRRGIRLGGSCNLDDLPPVPKKRQQISRGECIFSIAECVVLIVLLLAAPQYLVGYFDGEAVPLFNTEVLSSSWYLILCFGVADIVRSTVRLLEGRHNRRVLAATLATNGVAALAAIFWLTRPNLINGEFAARVQVAMAEKEALVQNILVHFDRFLLVVILLALVLDAAEAAIRTFRK